LSIGAQFSYSAFGLSLLSDFECPELLGGPGFSDVTIKLGPCAPRGSPEEAQFILSRSSCVFTVEGVARYRVSRGEEIVVEPSPDADWFAVRLFLFSTALGILLHQRLVPVLHGSSIVTPQGAVVFAGPSAAGKSTLAAGLLRRRYSVLTDEIAAISMNPIAVLPGSPALMVWKDALQRLGLDTSKLTPVRRELQKFFLPLGSSYESHPVPLHRIYVLEASNRGDCSAVALRGLDKFKALAANLYRPRLAGEMGLGGAIYRKIAELAAQTEVVQLTRPIHPYRLDELMDAVERDLV
jgi:hypothetical protein